MGNDLISWRTAIGTFYGNIQPMVLGQVFRINLSTLIECGILIFKYVAYICTHKSVFNKNTLNLALLLFMLLLLGGDIAENPGPNESGTLSILHLNIRSIRNKLSYIEDALTEFDILCFTETHLTDHIQTNSLLLKGYGPPYRKDKSAHSGGILVYVAEHLLSERIPNLETFWDECLWVKINIKHNTYFICTIYRPPSSPVEFWEMLNRNIETVIETSNNIILLGDINEDQMNEHNHKLKDILVLNSLKNVITSPTRVTETSSTLIDPIIVDLEQM